MALRPRPEPKWSGSTCEARGHRQPALAAAHGRVGLVKRGCRLDLLVLQNDPVMTRNRPVI